jgi:WD40 repeat protein/uncharacterized caspase-like protein
MRRMHRPGSLLCLLFTVACFTSSRALGQPAAPAGRPPEVWAIIAGINDYPNAAVPAGRTAVQNAQKVRQWIQRIGWDNQHQVFMSDSGAPVAPAANLLPTRQNLDWAIQEFVKKRAAPGDLVLFYFAGESRCVAKREGGQLDVRQYLLPIDGDPGRPEQTGWSLDLAVDECVRHKLRVVCWLATAPGDPAVPAAPPAPGAPTAGRPAPDERWSPGVAWVARLARWPGVTAWLASDRPRTEATIKAADSETDPATVFTEKLLNALGASSPAQQGSRRPNLAECLKELHQDQALNRQGFCSAGGVPPSLTLWPIEKEAEEPRPELVIQAGHADKVTSMVFPADGRLIVTGAMDSTIRIWSAPDRSLLRVLPGHTVGVTALALTGDDRFLISGGGSGSVLVHDRQKDWKEAPIEFPQPHVVKIAQIALLPDGLHFVSVGADGSSFLWDLSRFPLSPPRAWLDKVLCTEIACGGRVGADGRDTGFVAVRCGDGRVRAFDSAGGDGVARTLTRPSPRALAVSSDGRLLAAGYDDGLVVVHDLKDETHRDHPGAGRKAAVHKLVFSPAGLLAIGHRDGLRLIAPPPGSTLAAPGAATASRTFELLDLPPQGIAFSPGGDYLAASVEETGALRTWRIARDGSPSDGLDDRSAEAYALGITGNGRGLAIGDFSGGLGFRPLNPQGDEASWTYPAHRGKIQQLSATPDRQLLLFLDEDRTARIWDLKERNCRRLDGKYWAGAFIDDDRMVLVPDPNAADHAGRLVLAGRTGKRRESPFFAVGADGYAVNEGILFERVVVSADGQRVAAACDVSKGALVCVWETKGGKLTHWIEQNQLDDGVVALAFSGDGRYLVAGGESPLARLWDLSAAAGALAAPAATFSDPSVKTNITCAAIRPGHPEQVVTGHSDGQVHVWKWGGGRATLEGPPLVAREFATAVKALCFTPDGRYLAASGDGKRIWVGVMDPRPRVDALDRRAVHHDEQINALLAWRKRPGAQEDRPILISGSDDTTIRFWDLQEKSLRATFTSGNRSPAAGLAAPGELDWILYTREGLYDASAEATKLVHYRRPSPKPAAAPRNRGPEPGALAVGLRRLDEAGQLDQLAETHNVYGLGEELMMGKVPGLKHVPDEPSPISIIVPERTDPKQQDVRLLITLGSSDFQDVRLYHNDVPIPTEWGPAIKQRAGGAGVNLEVPVKLVPQGNRFYVMATQQNAYDSCSKVVEIDYQAPVERGRVHVVALGVKDYKRRALRFAEDDADELSKLLYRRGVDASDEHGVRHMLHGANINRQNIERVFADVARQVANRPQDTVVVFLAGHTGVFDPQRFCLLLEDFPFPENEPIQVAQRDFVPTSDENDKIPDRFVLPYSTIEASLARLRALNRLVIVDACQAESILDDPKVRAIRKWMERSTRRARTSYLMAARRGEPALEAAKLSHGLFTYALLRGMQAVVTADEPKEVKSLPLPGNADFNRDGIVSTDELDAYTRQVLPLLSSVFARGVTRSPRGVESREGPSQPASNGGAPAPAQQPAELRVQGAEASFPLVPLGERAARP